MPWIFWTFIGITIAELVVYFAARYYKIYHSPTKKEEPWTKFRSTL